MTRMAVAGFMTLAVLGAVAVLYVGSPTAEAAPSVSPFAGSWSGTWSDIGFDADGTWDLTISNAGQIKGRVYYIQLDIYGAFVGHVGADGKLVFVGFAPADVPNDKFNGIAWQGTAVIDGDGKLLVSVDRTNGDISLVAILERN